MDARKARQIIEGWVCDRYESLHPDFNVAPIADLVGQVSDYIDREFARLARLSETRRIEEQLRVDRLPRRRYVMTTQDAGSWHRTPTDCWSLDKGSHLYHGSYPNGIVHGQVIEVVRRHPGWQCICPAEAIIEATDEWVNGETSGGITFRALETPAP